MELKMNNKFVAYNGYLGRRNYILNVCYLGMINSLLLLPVQIWHLMTAGDFSAMYNFKAMIGSAPVFVIFCYALSCLISLSIGSGLLIRRLSDIFGAKRPQVYIITAVLYLIPYLWLFWTNPMTALLLIFAMIASIVVMCLPGKISGQFPHDPLKVFNWGAFWGTWIWGLFNRVRVTLWALPLLFTPLIIHFAIICGIKGNEWAHQKNNTVDLEAFHKGQKHQAIGWNIFAGFMIFILPFLLIFLLTAVMVTASVKDPEGLNTTISRLESVLESVYSGEFEEYILDVDENRFYMNPDSWVTKTFDERYNLLKGAASLASMKKKHSEEPKFDGYSGSTYTEIEITKIYSSYNGEVLAEFNMDESEVNDFKSAMKSIMNSVKFNTNPELPPLEYED